MMNTKRNEIECNRLVIKPFTESEKETIKTARRKTGYDRPTFYHDAVVDYATRINGEKS